MKRTPATIIFLLLFAAFANVFLHAQEPAFLSKQMVARYEEAPGSFHYVFPCSRASEGMPSTPSSATSNSAAKSLCWPAMLAHIEVAGNVSAGARPIPGMLMVSASLVRFFPDDANAPRPMPDLSPGQIAFAYDARQVVATMHTSDGNYAFAFKSFCLACTPGASPIDAKKGAQLEAEYRDFGESLTHWEAVYTRIAVVSAHWRVGVNPKDQPAPTDPRDALALYGDLNSRLAPLCAEPARSCVQLYAKYQLCRSATPSAECGEAPNCSATCVLAADAREELKAGFCISALDYAALQPDWTSFFLKDDAARAVKPLPPVYPMDLNVEASRRQSGSEVCTPAEYYSTMYYEHLGAMGLASLSRASSGVAGAMVDHSSVPPGSPLLPKVAVASGVMAGDILWKTQPQYPAVAKAARIQGTVVLSAVISKQGLVENLAVVSGPPLLVQAAVDAVKTWQYRPYLVNGAPVEVITQVNVTFMLGGTVPAGPPATPPSH